jgi:hypothetical protein
LLTEQLRPPVREIILMPTIFCNVSALAVATLFYYWRAYRVGSDERDRVLRSRITYMLWVMANSV